MEQPTLVVFVRGGLVSEVTVSPGFPPCRILLCDYDNTGTIGEDTRTEIRLPPPDGRAGDPGPTPAHVFALNADPDASRVAAVVEAWQQTRRAREA